MTENKENSMGENPQEPIPKKESNNPDGRPTLYKDEYVEQVYKLCLLGATDLELADFFEVTEQTITNWKHEYPEFFGSIKEGKEKADSEIAQSLFNRAKGYEFTEAHPIKIKEVVYEDGKKIKETEKVEIIEVDKVVPPDATSMIFWLKNRRKNNWRDKQEVKHSGSIGKGSAQEYTNKELEDIIASRSGEGTS